MACDLSVSHFGSRRRRIGLTVIRRKCRALPWRGPNASAEGPASGFGEGAEVLGTSRSRRAWRFADVEHGAGAAGWAPAGRRRETLPPGHPSAIGSGVALETGRRAMWDLRGCGCNRLSVIDPSIRDAFTMDVQKFVARFGRVADRDGIRTACLAIGRRLGG